MQRPAFPTLIPQRMGLGLAFLGTVSALSCSSPPPPVNSPSDPAPRAGQSETPTPSTVNRAADNALGGRLFDRFFSKDRFTPDDKKTPGEADGKGGPRGDGTLLLASGEPLLNDAGHDYRLKNFFGWDLRGPEGLYGPEHQNKRVLPWNLLSDDIPSEELTAFFTAGRDGLPAYGSVLEEKEIEALVAFVVGIREGKLPHPDAIWKLSAGTPGNYRLNPGANLARGKQLYSQKCASCHGSDGTNILFDGGEFSLGTHARQKAYEDWLKILNGQPGTPMKRYVEGETGAELGSQVLDILAALCDRETFPRGRASQEDVVDGDVRCGEYLR